MKKAVVRKVADRTVVGKSRENSGGRSNNSNAKGKSFVKKDGKSDGSRKFNKIRRDGENDGFNKKNGYSKDKSGFKGPKGKGGKKKSFKKGKKVKTSYAFSKYLPNTMLSRLYVSIPITKLGDKCDISKDDKVRIAEYLKINHIVPSIEAAASMVDPNACEWIEDYNVFKDNYIRKRFDKRCLYVKNPKDDKWYFCYMAIDLFEKVLFSQCQEMDKGFKVPNKVSLETPSSFGTECAIISDTYFEYRIKGGAHCVIFITDRDFMTHLHTNGVKSDIVVGTVKGYKIKIFGANF